METNYEQDGHVIGIPWRFWSRDVETAMNEEGPRVACATADASTVWLTFPDFPRVAGGIGPALVGDDPGAGLFLFES
jgi:hypothetical protein